MAGSFGALAAMNEAIKKNREMLKGKKEKRLRKDPHYFAKRGEALVIRSRPLSEQEQTSLIKSVALNQKEEKIRQLIALVLSIGTTIVLMLGLLRVLHYYMN